MKKMIDVHMHILPDVDDGAADIAMAEALLMDAVCQGMVGIFATSHSSAFGEGNAVENVFEQLKELISRKNIPVNIYLGCEVYCNAGNMDYIINCLQSGQIPSMNGTRYVLTEFYYPDQVEMLECVKKLIDNSWIPIIAHVERYSCVDIEFAQRLKDLGCRIQINAYSVNKEKNPEIRLKANKLLGCKLVDFIGSYTHRTDHRPVDVKAGIDYLYEYYDEQYVDDILFNNASVLLVASSCDNAESKGCEQCEVYRLLPVATKTWERGLS